MQPSAELSSAHSPRTSKPLALLRSPAGQMACVILGFLVLLASATVPSQRIPDARLVLYPLGSAIQIPALVLCLLLARRASGSLRKQWLLMAGNFFFRSAGLFGPSLYVWGHLSALSSTWTIVASSSMAVMLSLMALTVFLIPSGSPRKRALDIVMVVMLAFIHLMLMISAGRTDFSVHHLEISVGTAFFLLAISVMCLLGAATPRQASFHRIVVLYFGAYFITVFLCNWVFFRWMLPSQENFVNFTYCLAPVVFILLALRELIRTSTPAEGFTHPLFRNIPASVIAMTGATLIPLALYGHPLYSSAFVMLMVTCLVLRTHLSYQRMFRDRLELESRADYMEHLATEDTLTGVGNRRRLQREVEQTLVHHPDAPVALLLFDIDHFKQINDTGGHQAGDDLLQHVAALASRAVLALRNSMAAHTGPDSDSAPAAANSTTSNSSTSPHGHLAPDIVPRPSRARPSGGCFRVGGDEFAVFLPGANEAQALSVANAILTNTRAHRATVSIGVITSPHAVPLNRLLEAADVALYRAKDTGRNRVISIAPSVLEEIAAGRHDARRRFREA